jgi:hypothetical protein
LIEYCRINPIASSRYAWAASDIEVWSSTDEVTVVELGGTGNDGVEVDGKGVESVPPVEQAETSKPRPITHIRRLIDAPPRCEAGSTLNRFRGSDSVACILP